ncbi:MAG TPA: hypothetical protein VEB20_11255 [Azospirillaceae bacterium]|nr:hypothetical protein [Azospirillaceae bacterium]
MSGRYLPTTPEERHAMAETLGVAATELFHRGRFAAAHDCVLAALDHEPDHAACLVTLACVLEAMGRFGEAEAPRLRVAYLQPGSAKAVFDRALLRMRRGDYADGLQDYEARLALLANTLVADRDSAVAERHRRLKPGEDVDGLSVVLVAEQGLGDHVMFARLIRPLAERGARITVVARRAMAGFFRRMPEVRDVLCAPETAPAARIDLRRLAFDRFEFMGSLPRYFQVARPEDLPGAVPYAPTDPAEVARRRGWLAERGRPHRPKVGLVYQAELLHDSGPKRSIPVELLAALAGVEAVDWVNLQHGEAGRAVPGVLPAVIDATAEPLPFERYADLMAATDAVVSVDTLACNLAGALGVRAWVPLPADVDWRWGLGRADSPWYPSLRLVRQTEPGRWDDVVDRIAADVALWATRGASA